MATQQEQNQAATILQTNQWSVRPQPGAGDGWQVFDRKARRLFQTTESDLALAVIAADADVTARQSSSRRRRLARAARTCSLAGAHARPRTIVGQSGPERVWDLFREDGSAVTEVEGAGSFQACLEAGQAWIDGGGS